MDEPNDFDIRPAGADDLPACARLAQANNGLTLDAWMAGLGAILARDDAAMFVAVADHVVIAYGKLQWHDWTGDSGARHVEPGWHLSGVIVDPAWRRRGIGAALVRARIAWLREREASASLWYCTNARNVASQQLHAAFGFQEVTRDFSLPRLAFDGGVGILSRLELGERSIG